MLCIQNTPKGNVSWPRMARISWDSESHKNINYGYAQTAGIVPVFDLVASAIVESGNGSFESPYHIASSN